MKKREDLRVLSQSVLLEEAGLPRINTFIIIVIFAMVCSFIAWSMTIKIDEVTNVKGSVIQAQNENKEFSFNVEIPFKEIENINEESSVSISIPGVIENGAIKGKINRIEEKPIVDKQGAVYYQALVEPTNYKEMLTSLEDVLMPGVKVDVQIITGQKTLLRYLVSPVVKGAKKSS